MLYNPVHGVFDCAFAQGGVARFVVEEMEDFVGGEEYFFSRKLFAVVGFPHFVGGFTLDGEKLVYSKLRRERLDGFF